jgi:tRNA nucleotidyltransferase (CCA-adding enzyme)
MAHAIDDTPRWEHFAHDADMGIRGIGVTPAAAFEQAALALTGLAVDPAEVRPQQCVELSCEAPDRELLFADWINALIYEMAVRKMLFSRFEVSTDGTFLTARAWGEDIDRERHQPAVEPKGATYTELKVAEVKPGKWVAQCVVDV